jgi:YHS domain-containing protein
MKTNKKVLLTIALFISGVTVFAQNVEPIGKDKVANGGYDFVSYFTDNKAVKGSSKFTHEINGVKYQFASAEHKDFFKGNPTKYLSVCDGYCAWGVAEKGIKVPVNPETFKVVGNKLYLFFNGDFKGSPFNTLPEWNKNESNLLTQLPTNWAKLKK